MPNREMRIGDAISFDPEIIKDAPGFSLIKGRKFAITDTGIAPDSTKYADKPKRSMAA